MNPAGEAHLVPVQESISGKGLGSVGEAGGFIRTKVVEPQTYPLFTAGISGSCCTSHVTAIRQSSVQMLKGTD